MAVCVSGSGRSALTRLHKSADDRFLNFTGPAGLTHQPGLDGVRGLAVAAVVAFHLDLGAVSGGYLGVSLFFTLSGVLIGSLILNEIATTGGFSLPSFWRRRTRRLLPAALLTLAVIAVGRLLTADLEATSRSDVVAGALNVANWHFLAQETSYAGLFEGPSAVLHFWSLAIEEQFYLVAGLGAVLVARSAARPVRAVFAVASVLAVASFVVPVIVGAGVDRIYYGTDTRAGELMVGVAGAAVLASARRRRRLLELHRWLALAAVAALGATSALWLVATPGSATLRRGLLPLTAGCSLLVILGAMLPGGAVAALARLRPLRRLGRVSYALYLVHWPVIVIADRLTADRGWPRAAAVVAASVALAEVCLVAVERPLRRGRLVDGHLRFGAITAVTIFVAAVAIGGRTTQSAALLDELADAEHRATAAPATAGTGLPRVSLFGDSVAMSLLLSLGNATADAHFERTPSDVKIGCGIALSPSPPPDDREVCDQRARRFAATAAGNDVTVAVMISCQWELVAQPLPGRGDHEYTIGDAEFDAYVRLRYEEAADRLAAAGVDRMMWMRCPYLSNAVGVDGLSPRLAASRDPDRVDRLNAIIEAIAARRHDVEVLAFDEWVNARVDDPALRPDGSHFDHRRHSPAADAFIEQLNDILRQ